jgi:hypothetical protein
VQLIRLFKRDLAKEVASWVDGGLISADQARAICGLYGVEYGTSQDGSTGYRLLVVLGYLFIGLAVITLIGANWEQIPRGLRMFGLLALTAGTQGFGLRLYLSGKSSGAAAVFLLGNLFYGASIILVAQIYHLGEHMPDGVLWWALGSLPFGLLLLSPWLTLFTTLLALIWFVLEYNLGFFPTLFPLFVAAALYVLIKGRTSTPLFLTLVVSVALWIEGSLSLVWGRAGDLLNFHAEHFGAGLALLVFAHAFGHWLDGRASAKARDYGVLLTLWTLRFGILAMLVLSFADPWVELIDADWPHQASMWLVVVALLAAALWLGWKSGSLQTLAPIAALCVLSLAAVVPMDDEANAVYFQIVWNIALVAAGIWLMLRGIRDGISHYFFLGIATILLVAFMRYVDLIGDYVGGAILFMVLAALLLGAARYWRTRQPREGAS